MNEPLMRPALSGCHSSAQSRFQRRAKKRRAMPLLGVSAERARAVLVVMIPERFHDLPPFPRVPPSGQVLEREVMIERGWSFRGQRFGRFLSRVMRE
jgi:hypothetical protein